MPSELQKEAKLLAKGLGISIEDAEKALRGVLSPGKPPKREHRGPLKMRIEAPDERSSEQRRARRVKNKARRKQRQKRHPRIHGRTTKVGR